MSSYKKEVGKTGIPLYAPFYCRDTMEDWINTLCYGKVNAGNLYTLLGMFEQTYLQGGFTKDIEKKETSYPKYPETEVVVNATGIDTEKEAEEYYHHNPQDKEPIHIILVTEHAKKEIEDYYGELSVLATMNNEGGK